MKNKLKLAVAAVTLVVVGLVAVHPGAGSSGDAVQAGLVPHINVPVSRWDDLLNWLRWWKRAPVIRMTLDDLLRQHVARQVDDATRSLAPHDRVQVVAEVCTLAGSYQFGMEWEEKTPFEQAMLLSSHAKGKVGHISGGVDAFLEVFKAFKEGKDDRYLVLAQQAVCQPAQLAS